MYGVSGHYHLRPIFGRSLEREEPSESETKGAKRSMKQIKMIVLAAVCLLAVAAFAQQSNPPAQPPAGGDQQQGGQRRGQMSVDDQLKNLTDRLSLTADQQGKIKPFLEDRNTQMQALMKDQSLSQEDRRSKARTIQESTTAKIRDVLTDDQKKKYDEMQQEMRDRQRQRQGGGDSNPK
jgi:periplasmic protein CpxP/Spy